MHCPLQPRDPRVLWRGAHTGSDLVTLNDHHTTTQPHNLSTYIHPHIPHLMYFLFPSNPFSVSPLHTMQGHLPKQATPHSCQGHGCKAKEVSPYLVKALFGFRVLPLHHFCQG